MPHSALNSSIKFIAKDLIGEFLYWPVWWYSKGLKNTTIFSARTIKDWEEILGVSIWAKNLFTPMFGQYDIEGRLISFFMRLIQLTLRSVILAFLIVFSLIPIILWVLLPLVVMAEIYLNFTAIFS